MAQIRDQILLHKIALRLKALRERKGVSQDDIFEDTKIHIARIETAKINVSVSTLNKLCEYFEITLSEFFKKI